MSCLLLYRLRLLNVNWIMMALGLSAISILLIWIYMRPSRATEERSTSDEEHLKNIYNRTIDLLRDKKYFLNKNLKLSDLAAELGQNERLVSKAINKFGSGNFNKFINSFRVDYSKGLLIGGDFDHYTIEAIAEEAGFSNKVSFYNSFKSHVGMSPTEFKKSKQVTS